MSEFKPIETQEQLDAVLKERLERAERKAAERFGDYDELRAKADRLDELEAANKSELERANEELAKLRKQASDRDAADRVAAMRARVSKATGVPAELISGADEAAMTECAEGIARFARRPAAPNLGDASGFAKGGEEGGPQGDFSRFMDEHFSRK